MKKLIVSAAIVMFAIAGLGMANDGASFLDDPAGTCGTTTYSQTDALGDVVGTIPMAPPGPNNAWVDMGYFNGKIYALKNIQGAPSRVVQINPLNGAVINDNPLPFNGFVMGACSDGSGLWVCQWSPVNVIHKVTLNPPYVELSSFVPVTGAGFSARSINWDGFGSLYVGCNESAGNTKLIRIRPDGINIQEWATDLAVGWYMGGEFDSNAPEGANLFVVDNVGNQIKRLNLGAAIIVIGSAASPAVTPDVAEGLAFNGEYLWHNSSQAAAGVMWRLDDGFPAPHPVPNLDVLLTPIVPPIVIPNAGGIFNFTASVTRTVGPQTPFFAWIRIKYPNGSYSGLVLGPISINPPVGITVSKVRAQVIPNTNPVGTCCYIGYVGPTIVYPAVDSSAFTFFKGYPPLGDGPDVWGEAICTGDPFPYEVASSASAPSEFKLQGASPNPFNPTTTIRFQMPQAGLVNLKVYDMAGRLVATLVNGMREAGGHEVTFDGSNLSSGVYLYSLTAGAYSATGKMILAK